MHVYFARCNCVSSEKKPYKTFYWFYFLMSFLTKDYVRFYCALISIGLMGPKGYKGDKGPFGTNGYPGDKGN